MLNSWSNVFYLCQKFASQIYGEIWAENCAGLARNVPFCLAIAMYCQTAVKTVQNEYCMGKSFTSYSLLTPQVSEFYSKIVNNIFDSSDKWQLFDSDSCQSLLSAINNLLYRQCVQYCTQQSDSSKVKVFKGCSILYVMGGAGYSPSDPPIGIFLKKMAWPPPLPVRISFFFC